MSLADYQGKQPVVLVFYPFTFTGVCQGELCEIRDDPSMFEAPDAAVLAISLRHPPRAGAVGRAAGLHVPDPLGLLAPRRRSRRLRRVQRAARLREPGDASSSTRTARSSRRSNRRTSRRPVARGLRVGIGEGDMKFSDLLGEREPRAPPRSRIRSRPRRRRPRRRSRGTDPLRRRPLRARRGRGRARDRCRHPRRHPSCRRSRRPRRSPPRRRPPSNRSAPPSISDVVAELAPRPADRRRGPQPLDTGAWLDGIDAIDDDLLPRSAPESPRRQLRLVPVARRRAR